MIVSPQRVFALRWHVGRLHYFNVKLKLMSSTRLTQLSGLLGKLHGSHRVSLGLPSTLTVRLITPVRLLGGGGGVLFAIILATVYSHSRPIMGGALLREQRCAAIADGLTLAWNWGARRVAIQTDSLAASKLFQQRDNPDHQHASLVLQFQQLLRKE
ncbi:hypothetical protein LINGRAHAP2_LOCUS10358 [Linum grandiflorum]